MKSTLRLPAPLISVVSAPPHHRIITSRFMLDGLQMDEAAYPPAGVLTSRCFNL